jgi:hypothetical protein
MLNRLHLPSHLRCLEIESAISALDVGGGPEEVVHLMESNRHLRHLSVSTFLPQGPWIVSGSRYNTPNGDEMLTVESRKHLPSDRHSDFQWTPF